MYKTLIWTVIIGLIISGCAIQNTVKNPSNDNSAKPSSTASIIISDPKQVLLTPSLNYLSPMPTITTIQTTLPSLIHPPATSSYWAKKYYIGNVIDEYNSLSHYSSTQQTKDGNYIMLCNRPENKKKYIWVLKLDSKGNIKWQKTYGDENDFGYSIKETQDGCYIIIGSKGNFCSQNFAIWLLKLNKHGTIEWQKTYSETNSYSRCYENLSLQITRDGGFIISGNSDRGIILMKLNASGIIEWQKKFIEITTTLSKEAITETNDGGYIIAWNRRLLKLSQNGTFEWLKTFKNKTTRFFSNIKQTIDGGYIIAGSVFPSDAYGFPDGPWTNSTTWVAKLKADFTVIWEKYIQGITGFPLYPNSIQETREGNYIIIGNQIILLLNKDGKITWRKNLDLDLGVSIQQTQDGGYIVAEDNIALKLTPEGLCPPLLLGDDIFTANIDLNKFELQDTSCYIENLSMEVNDTDAIVKDTNATVTQLAP